MDVSRIGQIQQTYVANNVKKAYKPGNSTSGKDTLSVTSFAKELSIAKSAVDKTPDVRQARVDEIKKQMESGNYNVTAAMIADKFLKG